MGTTDDCAPLIRRFIELGINPGGVNIDLQLVKSGQTNINWYELFDFEKLSWKGGNRSFQDNIKDANFGQLGSMFFASLFYAFEASGLGYLTINPALEIIQHHAKSLGFMKTEFLEIINSTIRIMGDKYKYSPNTFDFKVYANYENYNKLPAKVRRYIAKVAEQKAISEEFLGEKVYDALATANVLKQNIGINIPELYIKLATKNDPIWISERGKRAHLHLSGGVCTNAPTSIVKKSDLENCENLWEKNYLSYHAAVEKRQPIRLHCEELTGQTDDQFERQRHFRNIILKEGEEKVKMIDLLSVTTTLEVGVDIGALQALMLANMPPQRFNYQQRVGRTGRRGQAYSAILTFCRGRSHDEFYFNNPHKITGDPPPTPFLANKQLRITKRLIAKELLRQVFSNLLTEQEAIYSTVHGQFGNASNWNIYKNEITAWLKKNQIEVQNTIIALKPDILETELKELLTWATSSAGTDNLAAKIDRVVANEDLKSTTDLSQKLAEGGVLPMFGMPTAVKNFYHGIENNNGKLQLKTIDRHQDLAIFEFAPNAQKTKDKAIHTAIGFTDDLMINERKGSKKVELRNAANPSPFGMERWMLRCHSCGFVNTFNQDQKPNLRGCPECGTNLEEPQNLFSIKSPTAYRGDLSAGKNRKDAANFQLSQPPIFAEKDEGSSREEKPGPNYLTTISDNDMVWRINTNGDNFFDGQYYNTTNRFPNVYNHSFDNQWITEDALDKIESNQTQQTSEDNAPQYQFRAYPNSNIEKEKIALAAGKNTEVFRLIPKDFDKSLDLNMFWNGAKKSLVGVRSAFFSAAFLLQRILADNLDIDPTEIEIADIRRHKIDENKYTSEIILTDALPNGSGFTRKLFDDFEGYLEKILIGKKADSYAGKIHAAQHLANCKDACYDCLKVFRNMNYHSLLDWRLGMALLRVMSDKSYLVGTDFKFEKYPELRGWKTDAFRLRDDFLRIFGENGNRLIPFEIEGVQLPMIASPNKKRVLLIVHPLWNTEIGRLKEGNEFSDAVFRILSLLDKEEHLFFLDTFNLHRRLGWCYEQVIKKK